jgi:hypothetical protein
MLTNCFNRINDAHRLLRRTFQHHEIRFGESLEVGSNGFFPRSLFLVPNHARSHVPVWNRNGCGILYALALATLHSLCYLPIRSYTAIMGYCCSGNISSLWLATKKKDVSLGWPHIAICYLLWSQSILAYDAPPTDPSIWLNPGSVFNVYTPHSLATQQTNLTIAAGEETGLWIYTGSTNPYCYTEIVYDTWWFQSKGALDHCSKEVSSQGCSLVDFHGTSDLSVFQNFNTITCIGIRTTVASIKSGSDPNWNMVYTLPVTNIFGSVKFFLKNNKYYFLNSFYIYHSLHYKDNSFYNLRLVNMQRNWLSYDNLVYFIGASLQEMLTAFPQVDLNEKEKDPKKYSIIKYSTSLSKSECNTVYAPVWSGLIQPGEPRLTQVSTMENEKYYQYPGVRMGTTGTFQLCGITTLKALKTKATQPILHVDYEQPWYIRLKDYIFKLFYRLLDGTLSAVVGKNWQGRLTVAFLTYYLTSVFTKSVGAGVFVSGVIVYNLFFQ